MAQHVGILGGTFDPIHNGHLKLAVCAREQLALDRVLLIPNERSPLKRQRPRASFAHRYAMVQLAVHDLDGIEASNLEGTRGGVSFMVDTLHALSEIYVGATFALLLGYDALREFPAWHRSDEILKLASLAAVGRGGETPADTAVPAQSIQMPPVDISSSNIRLRLAQGLSIDGMTSPPVNAYIHKYGLYASSA